MTITILKNLLFYFFGDSSSSSFSLSPCHVCDKTREKLLRLQVGVVVCHVLHTGLGKLHGYKFVTLLFESLNDFTNESTLDAIGLCRTNGAIAK